MLTHFRYTGILTIEFFVRDGRLIANEIAPRVHNSGHWSIEGAVTSQFENHLRAILGLPLGSTRALGHSAMVNLIGSIPPRATLLKIPGLHLHDYGKAPRPGRKVGHCTIVEASAALRDTRALKLLKDLAAGVGIP
jgi:5-(carboxyamino)imidazole ribonucleotide synthase